MSEVILEFMVSMLCSLALQAIRTVCQVFAVLVAMFILYQLYVIKEV